MIGIYCIENMVDGKKYIGQSKEVKDRWRHHKELLRNGRHHCSHLQRAWNKYGEENFKFYMLEEVPEDQLNEREVALIRQYNSFGKNGYNMTAGGEGQRERYLTDEEKRHLSEINMGPKNPNYGLKRSEETRKRMSEAMRGKSRKPHTDEWKQRVSAKLKNRPKPYFNKPVKWVETGQCFENIKQAAEKTGYVYSAISAVCRGTRKSLFNQHFVFIEENNT